MLLVGLHIMIRHCICRRNGISQSMANLIFDFIVANLNPFLGLSILFNKISTASSKVGNDRDNNSGLLHLFCLTIFVHVHRDYDAKSRIANVIVHTPSPTTNTVQVARRRVGIIELRPLFIIKRMTRRYKVWIHLSVFKRF